MNELLFRAGCSNLFEDSSCFGQGKLYGFPFYAFPCFLSLLLGVSLASCIYRAAEHASTPRPEVRKTQGFLAEGR